MDNERIKIVLIDDQQLFREGIRQIMQTEKSFHIITSSDDFLSMIHLLEPHSIDILLIDLQMFLQYKQDIHNLIEEHSPQLKVVILSTLNDDNIVKEAIQMGVRGYLIKEMDISTFIQAIKMINEGVIYVHPVVNEAIVHHYLKMSVDDECEELPPIKPPLHVLTKRESEVIQLLAHGMNNMEIAKTLDISEKTVKNHISSIFKKINVNDRTKAAILAIRNRWVHI